MQGPSLSVVIPCFNLGAYLGEAVRSALDAGVIADDVILVDDGSTDAATVAEVARAESAGIRVIRQANQGLARARNAAFAACRTEIVIPLDADNRLCPAMVEEARRHFAARPGLGVVYGDARYIGDREGRWQVGPFDIRRLMEWNYIDACAAVRREVWERNGGYDPTMPVAGLEDWDFWLGAHEAGWEFEYVPRILFEYRVRGDSMITKTRGKEALLHQFVARKHGALYRREFLELLREQRSLRGAGRAVFRALARYLRGSGRPMAS